MGPGGGVPARRLGAALRWLRRGLVGFGLAAGSALAADGDGDGLDDDWETNYFGHLASGAAQDSDGDGLTNAEEESFGSDPTRFDTDGDVLSDADERLLGSDPNRADTDGDGLSDYAESRLHGTLPGVRDTDGGGRSDGEEVLLDDTDPTQPGDDALDSDGDGIDNRIEEQLGTDPFSPDTDGDLLTDAQENPDGDGEHQGDENENGSFEPELGEETDPRRADTDADGLDDGLERFFGADPYRADSDADGWGDGDEHTLRLARFDCLDPSAADSDFDGVPDGVELNADLNPCDPDSDADGLLDVSELFDATDPRDGASFAPDADLDGLSDAFEQSDDPEAGGARSDPTLADGDGDGRTDAEEVLPLDNGLLTDPLDADTDDDGLLDGRELGVLVDGRVRGGSSPAAWDTDGDGLSDGVEVGLTAPELSPGDPDATLLGAFLADADPGSTTNPLTRDTDGDGLHDGVEDTNRDGRRDATELDPADADTDRDGMDDGWEFRYSPGGECPAEATEFLDPLSFSDAARDGDGDGLNNLEEYGLQVRVGLSLLDSPTVPCDADSDGDGLSDGVEAHGLYDDGQTDPNVADTDGDGLLDGDEDQDADGRRQTGLETDPTRVDTDGDGLPDAWEDGNQNGEREPDETDPRQFDTDGDGLSDGLEVRGFGTDPLDADSDEDGLSDGLEVGLDGDLDPVQRTDPLDPDTDADGLQDGVEDRNRDGAIDEDETSPSDFDSDDDGRSDGEEDANGDGVIDASVGETDPLDPDTDDGGVDDGSEVNRDGTDPNDPSDDRSSDSEPPVEDPSEPVTEGETDDELGEEEDSTRFTLEPGGEIRGSACSAAPPGRDEARSGWLWALLAICIVGRARRRRGVAPAVVLLLCCALAPRLAHAQVDAETLRSALNTDIDVNPHRVDPSGFGLLGISRPRVLDHLAGRSMVLLSHLSSPAVVADRATGATLRRLVGNRQQATLGAALGLFERYQVSLSLPVVMHQQAELPGRQLGAATSSGFGNPTLTARVVLLDGRGGRPRVGVELPLTVPVWAAPAYMGYDGFGAEPRLLSEEAAGPVVVSATLGALFKPERRVFDLRDGNQWTYGVAVQYPDLFVDWDAAAELQGATPLTRPGSGAETRAEALLGGRHRFDERLSVSVGAGLGLMSGIGQSSYRVFASVGYAVEQPGSQSPSTPDCPDDSPPGFAPPPGCEPAREAVADADGDGFPDPEDDCPQAAGPLRGCPDPQRDTDGDGRPDAQDECPELAEDVDAFEDEDGCPDTDNDGDGVADLDDSCPLEPEDHDGDQDLDGCPDAEAEPEAPSCPDGARASPEGLCLAELGATAIQLSRPVQFATDAAQLVDDSRAALDQVVDILDANPSLRVRIVGHTDAWGSATVNLNLSHQRARAVRWYLLQQSRDPAGLASRIEALGLGEERPIADNGTAVGRAKNRRVEIRVVSEEPEPEEPEPEEPEPEEPEPEEPEPEEPEPEEPESEVLP